MVEYFNDVSPGSLEGPQHSLDSKSNHINSRGNERSRLKKSGGEQWRSPRATSCLHTCLQSVCLPVCLSPSPSVCLCFSISLSPSLFLPLPLSFSLSLSLSPSLLSPCSLLFSSLCPSQHFYFVLTSCLMLNEHVVKCLPSSHDQVRKEFTRCHNVSLLLQRL